MTERLQVTPEGDKKGQIDKKGAIARVRDLSPRIPRDIARKVETRTSREDKEAGATTIFNNQPQPETPKEKLSVVTPEEKPKSEKDHDDSLDDLPLETVAPATNHIGIFPGSFDPFHEGHKSIVELAKDQFKLSKIYLLPLINPHKNQTPLEQRIKDLQELSTNDNSLEVLHYPKLDYWHYVDEFIEARKFDNVYRLMGETCYNAYPEVGIPPLRDEPDKLSDILKTQRILVMPNPPTNHNLNEANVEAEQKDRIYRITIPENGIRTASSVTKKIKTYPILGIKEYQYNKYYSSSPKAEYNYSEWEQKFYRDSSLKIGISHGTFDLVHEGHINLCETAQKELGLDFVLVWPSILAHHKPDSSPFEIRFGKLEQLLDDHPNIHPLKIKEEIVNKYRSKNNEGVNIVEAVFRQHEEIYDWIVSQLPNNTDVFRIFGSDSINSYISDNEYTPLSHMLEKGKIAVLERVGSPLSLDLSPNIYRLIHDDEGLYYRGLSSSLIKSIYGEFGSIPVKNTHSKHLPSNLDTELSRKFDLLAEKVGYKYSRLGVHKHKSHHEDQSYIKDMATGSDFRPVKFVITSDGRIWADNTHWALAALNKYGENCLISEIPHYFIDLRKSEPAVVNKPSTLHMPELDISVKYAQEIQERLNNGWRPTNLVYTISDLYYDSK